MLCMYNKFKSSKNKTDNTDKTHKDNNGKSDELTSRQKTSNPRSLSLFPCVSQPLSTIAHSTQGQDRKNEKRSATGNWKEKSEDKIELPALNGAEKTKPFASAPTVSGEGIIRSPRAQRQVKLTSPQVHDEEENQTKKDAESMTKSTSASSGRDSTTSDSSEITFEDKHLKTESIQVQVVNPVISTKMPMPPPKLNKHKNGVELASERVQTWLAEIFLIINLHSPEEVKEFIQRNQTGLSSAYLLNQTTKDHFTPFLYAVLNKRFSTALLLIQFGADPFKEPLGIKPLKKLVGEDVWFYYTIEAMRKWKPFLNESEKRALKFKQSQQSSASYDDPSIHSDFVNRLYDKIRLSNPI